MYHTKFQKEQKIKEAEKQDKLEKGFYSALDKAHKKYGRYLPINIQNFFEFEAHRIGVPHDCDRESIDIAWHACLADYDYDRNQAEANFY